jgi:23S rRNA pseudouridine1911/1915/1917 synthase
MGKAGQPGQHSEWKVTEPVELMNFLITNMPEKSRNNVKSILTHGQVQVERATVTQYNFLLQPGQVVRVNWSLIRDEKGKKGIKIVFEDQEIIVIDKPPGLLSIATDKEKIKTAYHYLTDHVRQKASSSRIFIVHRLDRDTSGLMLFAKSEQSKLAMQEAWRNMVIERAYLALVQGRIKEESGTIRSWLKENKNQVMYSESIPGDGREAVTHFRVIRSSAKYSLLEVRLETGRKNQIRVHLQDIGHSIIGDRKYGSALNPIGRLGLHAHILSFLHPASGRLLRFETEIPGKFHQLFR